MKSVPISIPPRFCGPPGSANGGYAIGAIARASGSSALEVTLRLPPALDAPMALEYDSAGGNLVHDEALVAEVRFNPDLSGLQSPTPPRFADAERASAHYLGFAKHPFPKCFVCGPARAEHDGLRIFAGAVTGENIVAAPWTPSQTLERDGAVASEALWAAMDCPGYFAVGSGEPAVLGRLRGEVTGSVACGTRCVVIAWPISREGRKMKAGTALFTVDGERLGITEQTWIVLRN